MTLEESFVSINHMVNNGYRFGISTDLHVRGAMDILKRLKAWTRDFQISLMLSEQPSILFPPCKPEMRATWLEMVIHVVGDRKLQNSCITWKLQKEFN